MSTTEMKQYQRWLAHPLADVQLTEELKKIDGDLESIKDRFYRHLTFGTAGIRGVMGAGTNRMNIYTIRGATQGFSSFLKQQEEKPSVVIGYDSRIKSDLFAKEAACVFASNGITTYLYPQLIPVPCVSFAIRYLHCSAGVMVTASHNPAPYNGYKAYDREGCQISLEDAQKILKEIQQVDVFQDVQPMAYEKAVKENWIKMIDEDVLEMFFQNILTQVLNPSVSLHTSLRVVYTPLHGAGNQPVREILRRIGIKDVYVVPQQEQPDGNFPTCPYPNPEIPQALTLGLTLSKQLQADVLLATDPDCDRIGVVAKNKHGEYITFSGNEIGVMLMEYICAQRTRHQNMPKNPVVVSTVVSTSLIDHIAAYYGVELRRVLTGFKFIGEQIHQLEQQGDSERYIFGFEESYGYLIGTHARDKDGVVAAMMIGDMAAYLHQRGKTLVDFLEEIYQTYGFYYNTQESFTYEGVAGMQKMENIMKKLQDTPPKKIAGLQIHKIDNYLTNKTLDIVTGKIDPIHLPQSAVLSFHLPDHACVTVRPSGTEPKIKVYYTSVHAQKHQAYQQDEAMKKDMKNLLGL